MGDYLPPGTMPITSSWGAIRQPDGLISIKVRGRLDDAGALSLADTLCRMVGGPDPGKAVERVRKVAVSLHEPSFIRDGCRPNCPGCRIEKALEGDRESNEDAPPGVRHERPEPAWCPAELPFGRYDENSHACLHDRGHSGEHGCPCGQGWSTEDAPTEIGND